MAEILTPEQEEEQRRLEQETRDRQASIHDSLTPDAAARGARGVALGSPDSPNATDATPAISRPSGGPRAIQVPSAYAQNAATAEADRQRMISTGSGISQIKNPILRTLARIGDIAGTAMFPGVTAQIPGTELHHRGLIAQRTGQVTQDLMAAGKEAQTAEEAAKAEQERAKAAELANPQPKPKEEKWKVVPEFTGPNGEPMEVEENSGQIRIGGEAVPGIKRYEKPATETGNDFERYYGAAVKEGRYQNTSQGRQQAYADWVKNEPQYQAAAAARDQAAAQRSQGQSDKQSQRGDRSYQATSGRIDKLRTPIESQLERLARLQTTVGQNTPQADSLIAPELLTSMAGGMGSGLRMNEAEIARIVGGRSQWESIKAAVNKWQTDPTKALSITPAQRIQIQALITEMHNRLGKKMAAIDEASTALVESDDVHQHRTIYNGLQQKLSDIDLGKEAAAAGGPQRPANVPEGYVFKDGPKGKGWYKP